MGPTTCDTHEHNIVNIIKILLFFFYDDWFGTFINIKINISIGGSIFEPVKWDTNILSTFLLPFSCAALYFLTLIVFFYCADGAE